MLLILPDVPQAAQIARTAIARAGCKMISHGSGRPWLLGDWPAGEFTLVEAGRRRLAVAGPAGIDAQAAEKTLGGMRVPADLDALAGTVTGSCHLVASADGQVSARATVSTSRQLFRARMSGVTVAADSPALLSALTGAALDTDALALRLLTPGAPWPVSMHTVWQGITEIDAGCRLDISPDGSARTVRWWTPPPAETPLYRAAGALRGALLDAVSARVRGRGTVSADLSGGLDSTCLCFLADALGARLCTCHWEPLDPGNDDAAWARQAAGLLPGAQHRFLPAEAAPDWFTGTARDEAEGPVLWNRARGQLAAVSRMAADGGASVHLTGLGADDVFCTLPVVLWSLVRRHPLRALPVVRRSRLMNRWPLLPTLRGLADRTPFPQWLDRCAGSLTAPASGPLELSTGWGPDVRMPGWATADAVTTVRRLIRGAAAGRPAPLDPDRTRHQILESVVHSGRALRQLRAAHAGRGVSWEAPYLDDRVLEAALSVRLPDRVARGQFKPLLTTAMRGIVPDAVLGRRSKGEFSAEAGRGFDRSLPELVERCDDLRLARLGLVDAGRLRDALLRPAPESWQLFPLETTLACETWLRSVDARPSYAADSAGDM